METHLLHSFERVAKWPMYIVIVIILASMFFGAADLFIQFALNLSVPTRIPLYFMFLNYSAFLVLA